jgi:hypothetical protein
VPHMPCSAGASPGQSATVADGNVPQDKHAAGRHSCKALRKAFRVTGVQHCSLEGGSAERGRRNDVGVRARVPPGKRCSVLISGCGVPLRDTLLSGKQSM